MKEWVGLLTGRESWQKSVVILHCSVGREYLFDVAFQFRNTFGYCQPHNIWIDIEIPVHEVMSPTDDQSPRRVCVSRTARLLKRLQRIEELPPADQRAVLKLVDATLDTRRRATPPRAKKRKVG